MSYRTGDRQVWQSKDGKRIEFDTNPDGTVTVEFGLWAKLLNDLGHTQVYAECPPPNTHGPVRLADFGLNRAGLPPL